MDIIKLDKDSLHEIKGLWEELNSLHEELSTNFKNHFRSFTFEERCKKLNQRNDLVVFAARDEGEYVGYCIATMNDNTGEIDSIYIRPEQRKNGIGKRLMEHAMDWLNRAECTEINIAVAEGNESVLDFYRKYGFKERFTVMQLRKGISD